MWSFRRLHAVGVCFALLSPALAADAQQHDKLVLGAARDVSGGYDSNPTLAVDPNARRDATSATGPGPGGLLHTTGNAYAVWGDASWLGTALNTDTRLYHSADLRHDTALSAFGGTELGPARLSLTVVGGRYDASFGSDNAWYGSLVPTLRLMFSERVSLGLEAHADIRRYTAGEQTNGDVGSSLELQVRQPTWIASVGADVDRRQSSDDSATRTQLTPFSTIALVIDAWSVSLRYAAFARWFDLGEQNGVEHSAEVLVRYRLGAMLSLSTRVGAGIARGQLDALRYERFYALAGLMFTFGAESRTAEPQPDRSEQGAAHVDRGTTRFEVCIDAAREVSVVGTFNEWSAQAGQMRRTTGNCFATEVVVPPGHHRYQWLVDGVMSRPTDAPAYAADGFGGEDAVLIVPE